MSAILDFQPKFRSMTVSDISKVLNIEEKAHRAPWTEKIFSDCLRVGYICELMEVEHEIIGYGVMSVVADEAHLFNVCVDNNYQGQGFGRQLLNYFVDLARQRMAKSIFLEVRPSNSAAVNLYESAGFNEVGRRKDYYPAENGREDALIMARDL
jgi:ribosomal-protein-alanine N-acetyltransferase